MCQEQEEDNLPTLRIDSRNIQKRTRKDRLKLQVTTMSTKITEGQTEKKRNKKIKKTEIKKTN